MLFTCLQNYGIFWNQSSGTYPACNIDIEGTASGPLITQIQGALNTLRPLLRMLTNPQPFTPGNGFGGVGSPRVSLLAGLAPNQATGNPWPDYGEPPFSFPSNNPLIPIMGAAPYGSTNNTGIAQTGIYSIDIPVGSFAFVAFATQNNFIQTFTGVSDNSGAAGAANIWHIIQPTSTSTTPQLCIAYCLKTTRDIPAGTGWVATTTGAFTLFFQLMGAMYIPGVGAPALRGSSTTTGTGTTFSVSTAAQAGDLVIGLTDSIPGFGTLTALGGFNQISYGRQTASWAWDYLLPTSSVTATYSKSWNGGSVGYQAIVAAFSGA